MKSFFEEKKKEILDFSFKTISVIISLVFYVAQTKWAVFNILKSYVEPAVSSIAVMIIGYTWTSSLTAFFDQKKIEQKVDTINENISKNVMPAHLYTNKEMNDLNTTMQTLSDGVDILSRDVRVHRFRSPEACKTELFTNILRATEVKNTCVYTLKNNDRFLDYTKEMDAELIETIITFLNARGRWHDVVSPEIIDRVHTIKSKAKPDSLYFPRQIIGDIPIVNFIIIYYGNVDKDDDKEIYFGFGLHEESPRDNVFRSTNRHIVETF